MHSMHVKSTETPVILDYKYYYYYYYYYNANIALDAFSFCSILCILKFPLYLKVTPKYLKLSTASNC